MSIKDSTRAGGGVILYADEYLVEERDEPV